MKQRAFFYFPLRINDSAGANRNARAGMIYKDDTERHGFQMAEQKQQTLTFSLQETKELEMKRALQEV